MARLQKISANMIPAVEKTSWPSLIDDISFVPAVNVQIRRDDIIVTAVGIIDTGADLCVLDEQVFKSFPTRVVATDAVVLATGFSTKEVKMYSFDLSLSGHQKKTPLRFGNVPVVVTNLERQVIILGRRGLLEWLKIELDFPRKLVHMTLEHSIAANYPYLSREIPSFDSIINAFNTDRVAEGTMMLAWEMERLIDRLIREDSNLLEDVKEKEFPRLTIGDKLSSISHLKPNRDVAVAIAEFTQARNSAAHFGDITKISKESVLAAAEAIIGQLISPARDRSSSAFSM